MRDTTAPRNTLRRLITFMCACIAATVMAGPAAATVGGPVILGGDDLTDHGDVDASGNPIQGCLYIQKALENISPKVTRANDGSVAALGSSDDPSSPCEGGGGSIGTAAAKAGLTVNYFDGETAINGFFDAVVAGTARPRIIWVAGTDSSNDLSDFYGTGVGGDEIAALTNNASRIDSFVNQGGGLLSHGTAYTWLGPILPGLSTVEGGSSGDLYLTPEGLTAFPGVTDSDINSGPWHNFFDGDIGGLQVLVRSSDLDDTAGNDAPVVIGGAGVSFTIKPADLAITKTDKPDPAVAGSKLTYTLTVTNNGPNPATGVTISDTLPAGVAFVSASAGCSSAAGTVTCNLGGLASGSSASVTIVVRPSSPGTITNTASVTGGEPDPNPANNSASSTTTVKPAPLAPPSCGIRLTTNKVFVGQTTRVTVTATRSGAAAAGVKVTLRGEGVRTRTAVTNARGKAHFTFTASREAKLKVTAAGNCGARAIRAVRGTDCSGLTMSPRSLTAGKRTTVVVRGSVDGVALRNVLVRLSGAGISASARTDRTGVARVTVTATAAGIVRLSAPRALTCSRTFGVLGAAAGDQLTGRS